MNPDLVKPPSPMIDAILNPARTPLERTQRVILGALQGRPVYGGTASPKAVARRHAANKAARKARRANRGA